MPRFSKPSRAIRLSRAPLKDLWLWSVPKTAVIGFDPLEGDLKFELTTPLLFADLLRWLSPEAFRDCSS